MALAGATAWASPTCTEAPKAQWQSADKVQTELKAQGYQTKKFKELKSCYEMYGKDKDGHRVEIYFDPVTGKAIKTERD
jgi:hypothetical protein